MEACSTVHDFGDGDRFRISEEGLEDLPKGESQTSAHPNVLWSLDYGLRRTTNHR